MSTLFDARTEEQKPTTEQVRLLEGYGFNREVVKKWSRAHAATKLAHCQRDDRIALARAADAARREDETTAPGRPSRLEREVAAAYLEETLNGGGDLHQALLYSGYVLADTEVRVMVGHLLTLLRGDA